VFTDYLSRLEDQDYRVVLYNLRTGELPYEDQYYLDRVKNRVIRAYDPGIIEQLYHQKIPLFVILKASDYSTQALFQEHLYSYPLAPVYVNYLYPKKLILVYNHAPESKWFIQNQNRPFNDLYGAL